ncbi:MAG: tRNA epoxyqueuosine(34) reductase QueG [Anaerolineales bacterium]|nr:tRNA epoxyqueuosine(34) reductase QueG [Anaerolineales bacterium]
MALQPDVIQAHAHTLGFDLVGISPAGLPPHLDAYREWLAQGFHGDMGYLARPDRVARRADPTLILPGVCSIVSVGLRYFAGELPADIAGAPSRGLIARYAWGNDYHDVMLGRLEALADTIRAEAGPGTHALAYVDSGALLERSLAVQAGLGFFGKNTCLIHPRMGSWLLLGELLVDVDLEPTLVGHRNVGSVGCGTCRRCIEACPTGALVAPYVLDARRCISYLTIELKGPIPRDLRPLIGNRIFGCDICQEVCPWQRFAQPTSDPAFQAASAEAAAPMLTTLLSLDETAFQARYRSSPIWRARRRGLLRNAAVALGNWGDAQALPALAAALGDPEPLVRGHAAWALGRIGGPTACAALEAARQREQDAWVREEIDAAALPS